MLSVTNLNKSYLQAGNSLHILKGLELHVGDGEVVAVVGQSGSGKSTLLSLLAGLDSPDSGEIRVSGEDIVALDEAGLAAFRGRTLGIVFQQFHLMPHLTALENIRLPLDIRKDPEANRKSLEAIDGVALSQRHDHYPHQLSGGECQRIAIARAFVAGPKLLLADEPSGNLDQKTGTQVTDMLFELSRKNSMTMVLVTHNQELAKRCDRILNLESGRLH